jgi:hypothetical protein
MPKYTLLDMVQRVLTSMDSDTVNSFSDTIESEQVAFIIRDSYYDIIDNLDIPEHEGIIGITASGSTSLPTHMTLQNGTRAITNVKYDVLKSGETRKQYATIPFRDKQWFLDTVMTRNSTDSNIQTVVVANGNLLIQNNKRPEFYTSFDDATMIFDSFDGSLDSTLQASKFIVLGILEPSWTMTDVFIPDLDANLFQLLLNESKSTAAVEVKQSSNPKAEQKARRSQTRWQSDRSNFDNSHEGPNYGRRGRSSRHSAIRRI